MKTSLKTKLYAAVGGLALISTALPGSADGQVFLTRPDAMIRKDTGSFRGNGIYDARLGQTESIWILTRRFRKRPFFMRIENDGFAFDRIRIAGTPGDPRVNVRYFRIERTGVRTNVTGEIVTGRYLTRPLAGRAFEEFRIATTTRKGTPHGHRKTIISKIASSSGRSFDAVRGIVHVRN